MDKKKFHPVVEAIMIDGFNSPTFPLTLTPTLPIGYHIDGYGKALAEPGLHPS